MRRIFVTLNRQDTTIPAVKGEYTMPITADYHIHSSYSGDSQAPMEDMIKQAIALGYKNLCFTEHMDIDYPVTPESPAGIFEVKTDSYLYDLARFKELYAGQIKLLFGIELGMQPHIMRDLARYAKSYEFDFIIASTHTVQRQDPYYPYFFENRSDEEAYRLYFTEELACMRGFTNFDVYGHIDYVIRYGKTTDQDYSYDKYADLFDKMIDRLIDMEKGIELNTGGLRKGLRDVHPCTEFLRRYRQKGGEIITIGSDAHRPEDIGAGFDRAAEILKDCGFKYYTTFDQRVASFHKI